MREGGSLRQLCVGSRVCTAHVAGRVARAAAALLRSTPRSHMAQRTGCRGGMRGGVAERGDPRASRTPGAPRRARTRGPHGAATRGGGAFPPAGKKKKCVTRAGRAGHRHRCGCASGRSHCGWDHGAAAREGCCGTLPRAWPCLRAAAAAAAASLPSRECMGTLVRARTRQQKKNRAIDRHGHAAHIAQRAIERCRGWG